MSSTNMTPTKIVIAVVALVVIALGAYELLKPGQSTGTTTQGGTFNTAHYAGIAINLSAPGANATSSSILNSSPNDYYISSLKYGCENVGTSKTAYTGAGLSSLTITAATSSTAAPVSNGNTNSVGGGAITIATSSPQFGISTSTIAASIGSGAAYVVWAAGSYLTFTANATNTATCTVGAEYFSS